MTQTRSSLFWVEPDELSQLLQEAGVSSGPGSPTPQGAASLLPARENGDRYASWPPFAIPQGPFEERLLALLDWVRVIAVFEHAFVVDQDGLALVRENTPLELIAASAAMSENWESLRNRFDLSARSYLAIEIGRHERLHLLAASSPWGLLSLGFVTSGPVPASGIAAIQEQFRRTLEKEGAE
ncbi:MAG: hypothetical protein GY722_28980 [bacterium]|nr:hypothetical protein [bacterium]